MNFLPEGTFKNKTQLTFMFQTHYLYTYYYVKSMT